MDKSDRDLHNNITLDYNAQFHLLETCRPNKQVLDVLSNIHRRELYRSGNFNANAQHYS